jgi:hypothetical protein
MGKNCGKSLKTFGEKNLKIILKRPLKSFKACPLVSEIFEDLLSVGGCYRQGEFVKYSQALKSL